MMKGFWVLPVFLLSCIQTENSSTLDAETYGSGSAVKTIFAKRCSPCHGFQGFSNDDLVSQGILVKGDPANSQIYYRLTGSTGPGGPKNMPQNAPPLTAADLQTIFDWVTNAN